MTRKFENHNSRKPRPRSSPGRIHMKTGTRGKPFTQKGTQKSAIHSASKSRGSQTRKALQETQNPNLWDWNSTQTREKNGTNKETRLRTGVKGHPARTVPGGSYRAKKFRKKRKSDQNCTLTRKRKKPWSQQKCKVPSTRGGLLSFEPRLPQEQNQHFWLRE